MLSEIFQWLSSEQEYYSGILLFEKYCHNSNLFRILHLGGATGKNRLTLAYELGKIVRHLPKTNQEVAIVATPEVLLGTAILPERTSIEAMKSKQKMLYKMLDNLHAMLEFKPLQERKKIAFQILDLDDQLSEINNQIAHYDKYGVIPVREVPESEKPVSALSEAELIRRQNLVRTYVSRYKRLSMESASLKDRDHYARLLEKYNRELGEIDKHLMR
jgi:hypothetical protein